MTRQIVLAVDVASDRDTIIDAITSQEGLAAFWTPDVSASADVGATLRFGFEPAPVDLELTLDALDSGTRVVWVGGDAWPDWQGTTMTWSFADSPMDGHVRVVLVHDGWADGYSDPDLGSVAFTWALVLGALKGYAETGTPQPALR